MIDSTLSRHPRGLLAVAAIVLAACGGGGAGDDIAAPADQVIPAALVGSTTLAGEALDVAALDGRPTVAWFWAPWCVVCRAEAPEIVEIAERYADRVNVVGVAGRGEREAMQAFVTETGTTGITHINDASGKVWAAYEIYGQPGFAFISDGGETESYVGSLGGDGLAERIERLLEP